MSRQFQVGPYIICLVGAGYLDKSAIAPAHYKDATTVEAIVKLIGRTDG